MTTEDRYDLVVVGAGSAGCVVAARASEDRRRSVLLVEAGPDPSPVPDIIADPERQGEVIRELDLVRHYPVERSDGSSFPLVSGRVMGGGSSVNNLSILRPIRRDFEAWQTFGGPDWSYDALLPVLRSIEDDPDFGDEPLHGRGGPIRLHRPWSPDEPSDPPVHALLEAAAAIGLGPCPDPNIPEPLGVCGSPYNLVDGRRLTVADAYLRPARDRSNLEILPNALATRLVVDRNRVGAVELQTSAGPRTITADRIVVAAGSYGTPHLLLLSGIGPPGAIESVGLAVVHRSPGVGENFQDHAVVDVVYEGGPHLDAGHRIPKIRIIAKSRPDLSYGDLHIMFRASAPQPGGSRRLVVSIRLLDHRSRGRLWLAAADPRVLPAVDPALVRDREDVRALVDGVELVTRLVAHPALADFYGPRRSPSAGGDIERHIATTYTSYNHAVGTCRVGPDGDDGAVVDPDLSVRGLTNLTIADASVLPAIPHAPTNLSAIMVGEIGARAVIRA